MSKFCTQCGTQLIDSMKFCGQCGTVIATLDTPTPQNVQIVSSASNTPAVRGWLLVICILLLLNGVYSLYNFAKLDVISGVSFIQLIPQMFGSLCGVMLLLKKPQWVRITKIYLGFQIAITVISLAMLFYVMFIATSVFSSLSVYEILIGLLLLIPMLIPVLAYKYLSTSERVKKTYPDAFK